MKDILVPVSPGELLDKITILRIKSARMTDAAKLANVRVELEALERTWRDSGAAAAASCPMSRRMVPSVREAITASPIPSTHTRVRRPSPTPGAVS